MADDKERATSEPLRPPIALIASAIVVLLGISAFWFLDQQARRHPPRPPVLTPEARAYITHLKLSEVDMKRAKNYFNQSVLEIIGKITNEGDRAVKLVEVNCVFHDPYGQVALRELAAIVGPKTGGLGPGQTKNFRMAFDDIPESWNQMMPQLVIARIVFG